MTIHYKTGNLFNENVEAVVNPVNCGGVMGRGLASQFKRNHPDNFKAYAIACRKDKVQPGKLFFFDTENLFNPLYIINFPTKRHWQDKSLMEDIEAGLIALAGIIIEMEIKKIAIPALGCGLGGLNWHEVRERIDGTLGGLAGVNITVLEPME